MPSCRGGGQELPARILRVSSASMLAERVVAHQSQPPGPGLRSGKHLATRASQVGAAVLLLSAWLFQTWTLWEWLRIDTRPPRWDESLLLLITEAWREFFVQPSPERFVGAFTLHAWKTTPFWMGLLGLWQALSRTTNIDLSVWVSNSLALLIIILATYGTGRVLYGQLPALCAALLVTAATGVVRLSNFYLLHLPVMAMVAAGMFGITQLLRPSSTTRHTVAASLLLALAGLTRYQSFFFLWLPTLYVLLVRVSRRYRQQHSRVRAISRELGTAMLLASSSLLLIGPFLYANRATFLAALNRFVFTPNFQSFGGSSEYDGPALTWFSIGWYARSWLIFTFLDQTPWLVLTAVGLLLSLLYFRRAALLLLGWIGGAYFVFWMLVNKEAAYDLPSIPAFALSASAPFALLSRLPGPVLRVTSSLLALAVVAVYSASTVAWHRLGVVTPVHAIAMAVGVSSLPTGGGPDWWWPAAEDWRDSEILTALDAIANSTASGQRLRVAFLPSLPFLQADRFRYAAAIGGGTSEILTTDWDSDSTATRDILALADVIITKTGNIAITRDGVEKAQRLADDIEFRRGPISQYVSGNFGLFASYDLPDNSSVRIYVRNRTVSTLRLDRDLLRATVEKEVDAYVDLTSATIRGEVREVLFMHPPHGSGRTAVQFHLSALPEAPVLSFGVALLEAAWNGSGDGVDFQVEVVTGSQRTVIWQRYLDPKQRPVDRGWNDARVDLSPFVGQRIDLRLSTGSGPLGDGTTDWAVWSSPLILSSVERRQSQDVAHSN